MLGILGFRNHIRIIQLTAQIFHHQFSFSADFFFLNFVLFNFFSALFLQIRFKDFHPFLHDLLHAGDMFSCNFFANFHDGLIVAI